MHPPCGVCSTRVRPRPKITMQAVCGIREPSCFLGPRPWTGALGYLRPSRVIGYNEGHAKTGIHSTLFNIGREREQHMEEMKILGKQKLRQEIDWRHLFTEDQLKAAADPRQISGVRFTGKAYYFRSAVVTCGTRSFFGAGKKMTVTVRDFPRSVEAVWDTENFICTCKEGRTAGHVCVHDAAVMLAWEKELGAPYAVEESEWEYRDRQKREAQYLKRRAYIETLRAEIRDFQPVSALMQIGRPKGLVLYDLLKATEGYVSCAWALQESKQIGGRNVRVLEHENRDGSKFISGESQVYNEEIEVWERAAAVLRRDGFSIMHCDCLFHEMPALPEKALCPHELLILREMIRFTAQLAREDLTDDAAKKFFQNLHSAQTRAEKREIQKAAAKESSVLLAPRIVVEDGVAQVSFKVGKKNGKMLVLRNLRDLLTAWEKGQTLELSKTESIDFGKLDFAEEARPWLTFIQRRVTELEDVNEALYARANSWTRPVTLAIKAQQPLTGAVLDQFYELAEGKSCEYTDKSNGIKGEMIDVGYTKMHFTLTIDQIVDTAGQFGGVTVSGMIPVMLEGASAMYHLNRQTLSRMEAREMEVLAPFRSVADASGLFRFRVGRDHLQEFYYRALPSLMNNPFVRVVDHTEGEPQKYLPPEPQFTFYLDLTDDMVLSCRCRVAYEDRKHDLDAGSPGEYRDAEQEARIQAMLRESFGRYDSRNQRYVSQMTDDSLYDFLQTGIARLEKYGDVHGTEAFKRRGIKPFSSVQVGVAVKSGIMDLSVTSKDYSQQELLSILDSYQKKKRYYRLKSGDYVDLEDNQELADLTALLSGLDLTPMSVIRQQVHLPLYRALYLDRMLQEHDHLAASRDRTYRALIKNFQTIRDADYEVPGALEDTLRPYQVYGYKWLKTLEEAGFGGILADEMGLGKTVQMIALFQAAKEKGVQAPSLVICPASLVYNWQAEVNRFAPGLKVRTITGTTGARKEILAEIGRGRTGEETPALLQGILAGAASGTETAGEAAPQPKRRGRPPKNTAPETIPDMAPDTGSAEEPAAPQPKRRGRPPKNAAVKALDAVSAATLAVPAEEGKNRSARKNGNAGERTPADVYITSYDLLKRDIALYEGLHFHLCVLDEAQYIKNQKAAAAKSVKLISADHRFALTGTPIENRLSELWSIFDYLMPGFLYQSEDFVRRFEIPISRDQDEEMTARLKKTVGPFILRRLKGDVLKDLPPKLEEVRYARFDGEQQKLYDAQVVHMQQMIHASGNTGEDKIRILAELTRIRQICCDPSLLFEDYRGESAKRAACMELVQSAMDGGHRMLIFSQFTSMLALLEEDLKAAGIEFFKITGSTPKETRISLVNQFNEGDTPVFLVSLKAGGTGLNLTGADVVIHYDPWWNLAAQNQATDRAHRIGQTRQVTVYKMIAKDTIEEKILELQEAKQDLADAILEGRSESLMSLSNEELLALLN